MSAAEMKSAMLRMWSAPGSAGVAIARAPTKRAASSVRAFGTAAEVTALKLERRDYQPSSRVLACERSEHLMFISSGAGRLVREHQGERGEHELNPGWVALVPAGTSISWICSTRLSFTVLRLAIDFVNDIARSVFDLAPNGYRLTPRERAHDPAVANIAAVLARETIRAELGGRLYAESLASMLAVHLLRHYAARGAGCIVGHRSLQKAAAPVARRFGESGSRPRAVGDALAFIHANYARDVSVADIAAAAHFSPFHLTRLFKQALGVSPHRYLIQVRVNSARSLLSADVGKPSLAEVASAVGFADQSHLTRHFKRVIGVTPGQFRV
jgi:AraC family transcriptional regulator